jgi:transcriptional regulator with XRE-family HTH domain
MGGQRAEDERDGAGVGLDEADALRRERFVGDEVSGGGVAGSIGGGVGARTAARTGTATEAGAGLVPGAGPDVGAGAGVGAGGKGAAGAAPTAVSAAAPASATVSKPAELALEPSTLTDSQILGRRLATARQHAGLSIEEVVAATRIRPGMLREIEAGEFVHCGGDVYARGHVRAIAKVVGIDPEPLLAAHPPSVPTDLPPRGRSRMVPRVEAAKPAAAAPAAPGGEQRSAPDKRSGMPASNAVPTSAAQDNAARFAGRAPSRVIRPAAEGATLAAASKGTTAPPRTTARTAAAAGGRGGGSGPIWPPQPRRKDDPGRIERHPKSANWTVAMLAALLGLVVFAGVELIDDGDGKSAPVAAPAPAPKPAPKPKPTPPPVPPAPKGVAVRIAAVGSASWLDVTGPDGHVLFDNLLPAGATQSFQDPKQLGVTLGNAGAVHMTLNGKDLGPAGGSGQVVHVTLKPTGVVAG